MRLLPRRPLLPRLPTSRLSSLSQFNPSHPLPPRTLSQRTLTTTRPRQSQPQSTSSSTPPPNSSFAPKALVDDPSSMARGAPIKSYSASSTPAPASPSASIILVSPTNKILLLHRIKSSSAFPSAHVFPGGNLDPPDGPVPPTPTDPARHSDSLAYRVGAIRELFEESGILLATTASSSTSSGGPDGPRRLLPVKAHDRLRGRKAVHSGKVKFRTWLKHISEDAVLDTEGLIPFTRWITPPNVPKRFTTQMYIYFVPVGEEGNESIVAASDEVETMAPEWMSAEEWVGRAQRGEIILFPPQFLLLSLVSQFLDGERKTDVEGRRERLTRFINEDGDPVWREKVISPLGLSFGRKDGRAVLSLDKPGPELKDSGFRGDTERVVLVRFKKEGPREVEVRWRKDVLAEERVEKGEQDGPESKQDWVQKAKDKAKL